MSYEEQELLLQYNDKTIPPLLVFIEEVVKRYASRFNPQFLFLF